MKAIRSTGLAAVRPWMLLFCLAGAVLAGCGGGDDGSTATESTSTTDTLSAKARLGQLAFNDASLSVNGQACASCHVAEFGHAQNNALAAQFGGPNGTLQGTRTAPMARYLDANAAFHVDAEGTPTGGFFWDGRAASLADQAAGPFLNPVEMAAPSKASVIDKIKAGSYASQFKAVFGSTVFDDVETAYARLTEAIAAFETESPEFHPYDSKYDQFLRGQLTLTDQESRGLALFKDTQKGNCASCHPADKSADGKFPLFTDFTYDALGVPRNADIKANADPAFYDLGLCASGTRTPEANAQWCGAFKVPSLRNVALRKAYFHNGKFTSLKEVVTFYVQRDVYPEKFYPLKADGTVDKFNDLPAKYHGNVNTSEAPYDRKVGEMPRLSDSEVDDVVAFLKTLTDGYRP